MISTNRQGKRRAPTFEKSTGKWKKFKPSPEELIVNQNESLLKNLWTLKEDHLMLEVLNKIKDILSNKEIIFNHKLDL